MFPMTLSLPNFILFFGVAGAGKSFAGKEIGSRGGYHHYELDRDLTTAMRQAIRDQQPFTDEMRDEFFEVVRGRILEVASDYPRSIFTQGVYKEKHRVFLREHIPGLECVWVQAPSDVVVERLRKRGESVSADYAALIERNFEAPSTGKILVNDRCSADELHRRFLHLFAQNA